MPCRWRLGIWGCPGRFGLPAAALLALLSALPGALAASAFLSSPEIAANPNVRVPLAAIVRFQTAGAMRVKLALDDGERQWDIWFPASRDPAAGLPVLGMRPGHLHRIKVALEMPDGQLEQHPKTLNFVTPRLPADSREWPAISVPVSQPERMEPGVTLLSVRRRTPGRGFRLTREQRDFSEDWGLLLALDAEGEVVWHYQSDQRLAGIDRLRNGNLIFHLADFRTLEIDMLGNKVREFYAEKRPWGPRPGAIPIKNMQTLHHQPHEMPSGNFLAFAANARRIDNYYSSQTDPNAPRTSQLLVGDTVVEFTPQGEIVWAWNTFEHLDLMRIGYDTFDPYWHPRGFPEHLDWTHGNGIAYDEEDDAVVFYLKHQDAVLKVDRASGEIRWIFGPPSGWPPHLAAKVLKPEGDLIWPYHAHNPRLSQAGTIVMYDNGHWKARPFTGEPPATVAESWSSGAEFAVDEEKMTVRELWRSHRGRSEDTCFANGMGDAHRLPRTDNMLVIDPICFDQDSYPLTMDNWDFSKRHTSELTMHARIREYRRSEPPEVLWEVILYDPYEVLNWQVYGGLRIPSLYADDRAIHRGQGNFSAREKRLGAMGGAKD